jgi:hypothetical protein
MEMDRIASAPEAIEPGVFTPGDFTPLWGQASACRIERTLRWKVTVPLITEFNYVACGAGHARHTATCGARVQQRLVVVKDANNGGEAFYIESIAPTDGRDDCNVGSGDFTGIVMYHTYDGGLVRFDCYEGGKKPAGFYLGGADGERERAGLEMLLHLGVDRRCSRCRDVYRARVSERRQGPNIFRSTVSPDISGLIGQYAHGNEPSHHILYLYTMLGQSWKTADRVRETLLTMYSDRPDGLHGNDIRVETVKQSHWVRNKNELGVLAEFVADP